MNATSRDAIGKSLRPLNWAVSASFVAVPLVKDKGLIGAVIVYRQEVRPFSEKQIELAAAHE
jgi:hypothetical protein